MVFSGEPKVAINLISRCEPKSCEWKAVDRGLHRDGLVHRAICVAKRLEIKVVRETCALWDSNNDGTIGAGRVSANHIRI